MRSNARKLVRTVGWVMVAVAGVAAGIYYTPIAANHMELFGRIWWLSLTGAMLAGAIYMLSSKSDNDRPTMPVVPASLDSLPAKPAQGATPSKPSIADDAILTPLQIDAFTLAKELRDFLASLPPFPSDPTQNPGEDTAEYLVRFHAVRTEEQGRWRQRLMHGYANRKFGERITVLMHRAGEEAEYPAYVPTFAEKPPMSEDDVRKLAQQMEMVAIWINRKQRNEVNLLG